MNYYYPPAKAGGNSKARGNSIAGYNSKARGNSKAVVQGIS